jgi:hypothetical protein
MTRPTDTKNAMLNGVTYTHVSCHSAYPGTTGANEIAGTRTAITPAAAVGGSRAVASSVAMTIPAAGVVRYFGFWNASAFVDSAPNGGFTPRNFMSVSASDEFTSEAHGFTDTQAVVFVNGVPPAPLVAGTVYFVRDAAANTFKVAATSGGAAINLTGPTSYGCHVCRIAEETYAGGGTHTLTTATAVIPD